MALFKKKSKKEAEVSEKKATVKAAKTQSKTENKPQAMSMSAKSGHGILLRPVISEKATHLAPLNKYTFEVSPDANKSEIKKAIKQNYGVMPVSVNISRHSGKWVRFGRSVGHTKQTKKAIVTLKKSDSIRLYEGT